MKKLLLLCIVLLTGCAGPMIQPASNTYRPMIDMVGSHRDCAAPPTQLSDGSLVESCNKQALLEQDYAECNQFAYQVNGDRVAANNAAAGAIFGALLGAAFHLRGSDLASVAAVGAVSGGAHGYNVAAYANMTQFQIVARCMAGRGYSVLN